VEHVALSVAIVATVERDVVPTALRVMYLMVVEEVFHRYQALSIGFVVIHSLSHQV
jgi:hypothetical protein